MTTGSRTPDPTPAGGGAPHPDPWVQEHFGFGDGVVTAPPTRAAAAPTARGFRAGGLLLAAAMVAGVIIGWHGPTTSPVSPGSPPVPVAANLLQRAGNLVGFAADDPGPRGRRR